LKNLLTDISGVRVGHADDAALASGVTAVVFDQPAVAAIDVRGGGPGTREESVLGLANAIDRIDAIALSGGSAGTGRSTCSWLRRTVFPSTGWRSRLPALLRIWTSRR